MTNSPPLPQPGDNGRSSATARTYEVGYGRTPVHSRVKPGQVLNPRGRPKGQRDVKTVLSKALNERTKIREGNRTRTVTKLDAMILKMINDAHTNPKVQANLIALMKAVGMIETPEETTDQAPLTVDDQSLIDDFFERKRHERGHTEPSEPETPTPETNTPSETSKPSETNKPSSGGTPP